MREVAEERAEELRSPLKSTFGSRNDTSDLSQYADDPGMDDAAMSSRAGKGQREDASAMAQNGSGAMDGDDDRHGDHDDHDDDDEDMDDDMMDKLSRSPSIEDGGCLPRQAWPARSDSLRAFLYPHLSLPPTQDFPTVSSAVWPESGQHVSHASAWSTSQDIVVSGSLNVHHPRG